MLGSYFHRLVEGIDGKGVSRADISSGDSKNPHTNEYYFEMYLESCAPNFNPLPVVIKEGKGAWLWDVTGKKYIDFMAGHGAVNQGHCHPKIIEAMMDQAKKLTMISHIALNDQLPPTCKYLRKVFGFDKVLLMNTGADAVETAVLIARKWGYEKKKVLCSQAQVLFPTENFWGKTIGPRCASDTESLRKGYEPLPLKEMSFDLVEYNNIEALEAKFKANPNIVAFHVEPIQANAGIIIPDEGYLKKVRELCTKYNVLMIVDEVFMGLGRTGKLFCYQWEDIRPDVITIAKSLSGGFYPVSAVLADDHIMSVLSPSDIDSTYCANPMAAHICRTAVQVLIEEGMIENSYQLGFILKEELEKIKNKYSFVKEVRAGKGLVAGFELDNAQNCWIMTKLLLEYGMLIKPGKRNSLRFHPPLVITEEELRYGISLIEKACESLEKSGKNGLSTLP